MPATTPDKGHAELLKDLRRLLLEAEMMEFHDFHNTKYETPKIELHKQLTALAEKAKDGAYDN